MIKNWLIEGTSYMEYNVNDEIKFGLLWDGEGNAVELLESGSIAVYFIENDNTDFVVFDFEVVNKNDEQPYNSIVKILDIA